MEDKVKILFLTASPNAAASYFYWHGIKSIGGVKFYRQGVDINKFDVCLVMTYDHSVVKDLKKNWPHLKIGIVDPRNNAVSESAAASDFLICDSIEMEDYWRKSGKPIFRYVEYPNIPNIKKKHEDKDVLTIGYHGNSVHLDCMSENVTPALEKLSKKYNIEMLIMCSQKKFTGEEKWVPKGIKISQCPWSMENYERFLSKCDVGIAPNNLIHNDTQKLENSTQHSYNYSQDDYSLRFKMPSNPGRAIIFGKLGIPCVSDFYPSAIQLFDGTNGYVAHNEAGWYWCLDQLLSSAQKRQEVSDSFQKTIEERFDFEKQNKALLYFLEGVLK